MAKYLKKRIINKIKKEIPHPYLIDTKNKNEFKEHYNKFLDKLGSILSPKQEYFLRKRLDHTLEEIANEFKVTRQRVNQIEDKAFKKLRSHICYEILDKLETEKIEECISEGKAGKEIKVVYQKIKSLENMLQDLKGIYLTQKLELLDKKMELLYMLELLREKYLSMMIGKEKKKTIEKLENLFRYIDELKLSVRTYNCLKNAKVGVGGQIFDLDK